MAEPLITKTDSIASVRVFLNDPDGEIWSDALINIFYDQFIEEVKLRNPFMDELASPLTSKYNIALRNYCLAQCYSVTAEDSINDGRVKVYTSKYEKALNKLCLK